MKKKSFLEEMDEACRLEEWEIRSSDNIYYAGERGNPPVYQYFFHGGPNHIFRECPSVREFLREHRCVLLPNMECFLELQRAFALSPRSRKIFNAQKSPEIIPSENDLMMFFVLNGRAGWFAEHFLYPERVVLLLEQERKLGHLKRGF